MGAIVLNLLETSAQSCHSTHGEARRQWSAHFATTAEQTERDVVVVGGGPAGLALASALGMSPRIQPQIQYSEHAQPGQS